MTMARIPIHRNDLVPPETGIEGEGSDCGALTDVPLGWYALSLVTTPHTPVGHLLYHSVPIGQRHRLPYRQFILGKNQECLGTYVAIACNFADYAADEDGNIFDVGSKHRLLKLGVFIPPNLVDPDPPDEEPC